MNAPGAGAEFWDIDEGITDPVRFFALIPILLPNATHLFIEGSSISKEVVECYKRFADAGPYLPKRQTLWPRGRLFRCVASVELFSELSTLSARHATSEVLDHLALYQGERVLLAWHDAFANAILLDGELPATTVAALADAFGCEHGRAPFPKS
jgi:hypothetical protein